MSGDSNKYNMKYSAISNQKDKYFLIHSVWQITGKLIHMRVYLGSCSYKQSTSSCATKTNHLSEGKVSGKPLLALWVWWSHWWGISLRRAKFTERNKKTQLSYNYVKSTTVRRRKKNHGEYSVRNTCFVNYQCALGCDLMSPYRICDHPLHWRASAAQVSSEATLQGGQIIFWKR